MLDIHIQVDPAISVSEGHHIGEWATRKVKEQFPKVEDIVFHIDAEDDMEIETGTEFPPLAPLRNDIRTQLNQAWSGLLDENSLHNFKLHYLEGKVDVEVYLDIRLLDQANHDRELLIRELALGCKRLPWIGSINTWYG